jgi:hypothetical protein
MEIFEFYFNPRRKDLQFKSFTFKGQTQNQKILGSLCLVGEIENALLKDKEILEELSQTIKEEFFSQPERGPEKSLKEALKKGNKFLADLAHKGNVRWLGNLDMAVLNVNNFNLFFSKTGNIKILLLRGREFLDVSENLELQEASSYPLKTFSNLASGRLAKEDKIFVLTKEVFEFFSQGLAVEFLNLKKPTFKDLKRIFKSKKGELEKIAGIFFLISMGSQKRKILRPTLPFPRMGKKTWLLLSLILILSLSYLLFRHKR